MIKKVLNTIKERKLIENGDKVIVGVSGGPDSVCLLHVLNSLCAELNMELFAVHVNHMLRGEESECDEKYVTELCQSMYIPLYKISVDIKSIASKEGISLEEAGREARYKHFDLCADRVGASKITVAHNKNDQAETVLMHLIRGSGLTGLKGMDYVRGRIIRPLLEIGREEIECYCEEHSLNPRIDSSNLKSIYTRNKVRLDLIPYINELFHTNIVDGIHTLSFLIKDDHDFVEKEAKNLYNDSIIESNLDEVKLDIKRISGFHPAMLKRVIRNAIMDVKGEMKGIESIHVEEILHLVKAGRTGAQIHLPYQLRALRSYDILRISRLPDKQVEPVDELILIPGKTCVKALDSWLEAVVEERTDGMEPYKDIESQVFEQFFDYEKCGMGINIRTRKDGDIFKPYRSNGTKKLKEYLIDHKIPREIRSKLPLIAKNNEILWIVGYKISDKFKVTENTKKVLKLKYVTGITKE